MQQLTHHNKVLTLSTPKIMGILNLTPDSFSDGGLYSNLDHAINQVALMIEEGASIIDIGGESTRPDSTPVDEHTELSRIIPVIQAVRAHFPQIWISVDTYKASVFERAYDLGADIWNDVSGLKHKDSATLAATLNCPVMVMHMRGTPQTMTGLTQYHNIVTEVYAELDELKHHALAHGVNEANLLLDIGFGFAKTIEHNWSLLKQIDQFDSMKLPMVLGISRKRFLAELLPKQHLAVDRVEAGLHVTQWVLQRSANTKIIRTHDVKATKVLLNTHMKLTDTF